MSDDGISESLASEDWRKVGARNLKRSWTGRTILETIPEDVAPAAPHNPSDVKRNAREATLRQLKLNGYGTIIECCCSPESELGKVSESIGIAHIRMTEHANNLSDPKVVEQMCEALETLKGVDLCGSLPCAVWSVWQWMSIHRYYSVRFLLVYNYKY